MEVRVPSQTRKRTPSPTHNNDAPNGDPPTPQPTASWKVELSGGALAGLLVCVGFYPLESVEARMQVGQLSGGGQRKSLSALVATVWRGEGTKGLYRGVVPTATGMFINMGLYFALFDHIRTRLRREFPPAAASGRAASRPTTSRPKPALGMDFLAAAASGAACAVLVNPFWVLKLRRITATPTPAGSVAPSLSLIAETRRVVATQGVRGLWRGTLISVCGVVDGALQLALYDQMKYRLTDERGHFPAWAQLFAGGSSRAAALVATYPYQLLRSVLQQQNCPYAGVVDATRQIVAAEGLRGLYKGIGLNLTRSLPPAACMFLILEQFRLALGPTLAPSSSSSSCSTPAQQSR